MLDALRDRAARALRDERGITIVEVVVAAMLLAIGALAVLGVGDAATRNTYRAEQSQVVVNRLQHELEKIRQLPFSRVALTAAPATSSDPNSPASRVSGTQFDLNRDATQNLRPLAINGGTTPSGRMIANGSVNPGPVAFASGDVHGQIYRYVSYPGVPPDCPGCSADNIKRIVVAILLDETSSGGPRIYQEIQSDVANPDTLPSNNPVEPPPPGGNPSVGTFWLTDTPCSQTSRQPLGAEHATHNTRGVCADGVQTGNTRGAPDLMFNAQPPEQDAGNPAPLIDYATDVEPAAANDPYGLTIRRPADSDGCLLQAPLLSQLDFAAVSTESAKHQKMHMWLSNELTSDFRLLTEMTATLTMWTKTINNAVGQGGKLCVWVFKRVTHLTDPLLGTTVTVDVPALNVDPPLVNAAHFEKTINPWPNEWRDETLEMNMVWSSTHLDGLNIVDQPRLGLAIMLERSGTSCPGGEECGLEFMYDHPNVESRLEVQTEQDLDLLP